MYRPSQIVLVVMLLLLSACSSVKKKAVPGSSSNDLAAELPGTVIKESEVSSEDVEKNIEMPYKSSFGEIALDDNEHVQKWVRYFQGKGRPYMQQYLSRSTRYLPMMKNVLRENGLPEELVYISLIESGFSPRAHSRSNAVGYWQFIKSTGRRFGLHVDPFIDERRDPVLSTRAAAEYFKALYSLFGSWHLSMAAYNVGEMRVKRAVTRYYTKDFWALIKKRRALPAETKNYVPKFIAAVIICKDPKKYGFSEIDYQDPLSYDTVALNGAISITKLANNLNVDPEELKLLNPKFRTDFVPISRGTETFVRIPVGRADDAQAALSMSGTVQPKVLQAEYYFYRIHRGDTLSTVARKHRTTVSRLRRLNNLSNRTMLHVGRSIKVPDPGGDGIKYASGEEDNRAPSGAPSVESSAGVEFHTVRRGENLTTISRKYGVSVSDLLRMNNLGNHTTLRKGQKLRVKEETFPKSAAVRKKQNLVMTQFKSKSGRSVASAQRGRGAKAVSVAAETRPMRRHVVRRGETLFDVSKKYGVGLNRLARANGLRVNYRVMAGQRLLIPD